MVSFAQRMGFRPVRTLVQSESLDDETRTELWNIMLVTLRRIGAGDVTGEVHPSLTAAMWSWEFKKPRDEQPDGGHVWSMVKQQVLKGTWYDALDIVEVYVGFLFRFKTWQLDQVVTECVDAINSEFETNMVGYRLIGQTIVPLDNEVEAQAVTDGINASRDYAGARAHLQRAADLLSDRKSPDYPNSVKESISAVEAVVNKVTREGTLGAGLKKLKTAGVTIHPALESAWSKMYGWTSDANGVRHAAVEPADADQAIAKYMLVTCAGFVTYLIETGRKSRLV